MSKRLRYGWLACAAGRRYLQTLAKKLAREYKAMQDQAGPVKAKTKQQTAESGAPASEVANKTGGGPKFPKCGDSTRDNVRNLLFTALCKDGNDPRAGNCAVEIETELNSRYGTDKKTVLTKVRSLLVVLRDVNNVELRSRLLSGDLQCQEFLNTDIKDLLSKERKEKEQEMKKKRNRDAAMAFQQGAHTDQYPCPKCKAKDAIYTQLQTRSADEPMTTFCACNVCGNRWKFC